MRRAADLRDLVLHHLSSQGLEPLSCERKGERPGGAETSVGVDRPEFESTPRYGDRLEDALECDVHSVLLVAAHEDVGKGPGPKELERQQLT